MLTSIHSPILHFSLSTLLFRKVSICFKLIISSFKTLNVAKCPHHDLSTHIPTTLDCDADSVLSLGTGDLTKVLTIYAQGAEILIFATTPIQNDQTK